MTELPPDIPPWSPLADPARAAGGGAIGVAVDEPVTTTPPDVAAEPDGATATPAVRPRGWLWAVAGLAAGLVLALAVAAVRSDEAEPPATTTVRSPLPPTSFDEPAAVGTQVALGNGWTVVVRGSDFGATRALRRSNPSTTLPEGQQYVLIDLEMSYVDGPTAAESPFHGVDLGVVGEDDVLITPADAPCTAPAPAFDQQTELPRGSTERGRVCFAIGVEQAASLRLVAEPSMAPGSEPSWFALSAPD